MYPRIITPNGDGWNDKAIFQFDNPQLLPLTGKIFGYYGAVDRESAGGSESGQHADVGWERFATGGVVPAGIYLYSVATQGSTLTGTVVVWRGSVGGVSTPETSC